MRHMHDSDERVLVKRLIIIASIALIVTIVYVITHVENCTTQECFELNMLGCSKARYINEEPEATWGYEIVGVENEQCAIDVTLLNAKQGSLGIDSLQGENMRCYYPETIVEFPEKNLDLCHGRLKESLQERIITQLHEYIIGNLGEINQEITGGF